MIHQKKRRTWDESKRYYEELRGLLYEFVEKKYRNWAIHASEITYADAIKADSWTQQWDNPQKMPTWLWVEKYKNYNRPVGIKRFDIALSAYGKLCALCYGVPSRQKIILKLHLLGRDPRENPLNGRIFEVILSAATMYGGLIGSKELWLIDPLNDDIAAHYIKFGFKISYSKVHAASYLYRSI